MTHLATDTLERYSIGRLTEDGVRRTEEHLLVCHECRDRLDAFETFLSSIRSTLASDVPKTLRLLYTVPGGAAR